MRMAFFGHWNLCRWKNTCALGSPSATFQNDCLASLVDRSFLEQARKEVAVSARSTSRSGYPRLPIPLDKAAAAEQVEEQVD
jgi:hypothetical protein